MRNAILALCAVAVTGCAGGVDIGSNQGARYAAGGASMAQLMLAGYSVAIEGGGTLRGAGINTKYIAVDAESDVAVIVRAPEVPGAPPRVVWRFDFTEGGQLAWRAEFVAVTGDDEGKLEFRLTPAPWEEARTYLTWLPPARSPLVAEE